VHGGFKICGRGSGDADNRLHGGIEVKKKIRPANSQEVVMARRKEQWRGGRSSIVYKRVEEE
jgi:hypothetical protein